MLPLHLIDFIYTPARVGRLIFWHTEKPELIGGMDGTCNFLVKAGKVITTKSGAERLKNNTLGLGPYESTHIKSPEGNVPTPLTPCKLIDKDQ